MYRIVVVVQNFVGDDVYSPQQSHVIWPQNGNLTLPDPPVSYFSALNPSGQKRYVGSVDLQIGVCNCELCMT